MEETVVVIREGIMPGISLNMIQTYTKGIMLSVLDMLGHIKNIQIELLQLIIGLGLLSKF
jgi:hypothetical protein